MATITLKNVPEDLHRRLKARAERNRRSLNREAIRCLEEAVGRGPDPDDLLRRLDTFRDGLAAKGVWITSEDLRAAREEGRP